MSIRQRYTYRQDDGTFDFTNALSGILPDGVCMGFDFEATNNMTLKLVHTISGHKYLDANNTDLLINIGIARTNQGSTFQFLDEFNLTIAPTTTFGRIDAVIITHNYLDVQGGQSPSISVIGGVASATPEKPSLTDEDRQTVIGYLTLPDNCSTLDTSGVSFEKNDVSLFHKGNFDPDTKANQADLDAKADQVDLDALAVEVGGKADASLAFALTDAENVFTKQISVSQGANITDTENIALDDTGNYYLLASGNVNTIKSKQNGLLICLQASSVPVNFVHNQPVGAGFKPVISASGKNVSLISTNELITLRETNIGFVIENYPFNVLGVPIGSIMAWSGGFNNIPTGWAWCDGQNGRPDLRGRFLLGSDNSTYLVGSSGGASEHTLTESEMPEHNHESGIYDNSDDYIDDSNPPNNIGSIPNANPISTGNAGGGQPHNNMPPYLTSIYIIKES